MRVLYSSSDLREQTELVKRLLDRRIPCGVKRSSNSQLSVWIQHDSNFPHAVTVFAEQKRTRPVPLWVYSLDEPLPEGVKEGLDKSLPRPEDCHNSTVEGKMVRAAGFEPATPSV